MTCSVWKLKNCAIGVELERVPDLNQRELRFLTQLWRSCDVPVFPKRFVTDFEFHRLAHEMKLCVSRWLPVSLV